MPLARLFVLLLGLLLAAPTQATPVRLVVFGDSLSDPGNAYQLLGDLATPPYQAIPYYPYRQGRGRYSNGRTWVELLGRALRDKRPGPALRHPGYTNFAVAAARARDRGGMDLPQQLSLFLDRHPQAPDTALYVLMIGANDVRDALAALATDPSGATSQAILAAAVDALEDAIRILHQRGARRFLVANVPDLALIPLLRDQPALTRWAARLLALAHNQMQAQRIDQLTAQLPIRVTRFDLYQFLQRVTADPGAYGLDDVATPCLTPGVLQGAVCSDPHRRLFWDGLHPTARGHWLMARAAWRLLRQQTSTN